MPLFATGPDASLTLGLITIANTFALCAGATRFMLWVVITYAVIVIAVCVALAFP